MVWLKVKCGRCEQIQIEKEQQDPDPISLNINYAQSVSSLSFWHYSSTDQEKSYQAAILVLKEEEMR